MKRQSLKLLISCLIFLSFLSTPRVAQADSTREFLMSATYGVLAGALVGAATLAFRDNPGDNLKSIAVGASLGLYAGILLGAYVVYLVPDGSETQQVVPQEDIMMEPPATEPVPEEPEFEGAIRIQPVIGPTLANGKIDGGYLGVQVAFF